ncbi:MAG TPA: carboxypeptidase-like regulatory domain-containing protein [Candidatus Norongarragalinales archaeon]|nr:carboxypeptidase-like regulatory domain-containing protein [Candidatus Norongarragalinales archaeon]
MVFEELEEQYEGFAAPLREQGIPLPSFTMMLGIIALLLILILFLLFNPFAAKITTLNVEVLFGKKPLELARVEVLSYNEVLISEALTGKDGKAYFESVPPSNIIVRATKKGVGTDEKKLASNPGKVTLVLGDGTVSANATVNITLALVDESTKNAVASASINYAFADEPKKKYKAVSLTDGKARFSLPLERAVNLVVEHPDYDAKSLTLKATREKREFEVNLRRRTGIATPLPNIDFTYGTLRVAIEDSSGNPLDPSVELFDATVNSKIDTKKASNGKVSFPDLLTGSKFYIIARLAGYLDYDGSFTPVEIGKKNEIKVTMRRLGEKGTSQKGTVVVRTLDEEDREIPAKVQVVYGEEIVGEKSSSGRANYDLSQLSALPSFRFSGIAEGRLQANSETFSPEDVPGEISLTLITATPENSAKLKVVTKGRKGVFIAGAVVKVYSEIEGFHTSGMSDSDGAIQFLLAKNMNYQVVSEYNGVKGVASVALDGDKELVIFLGEAVETVKVSAIDAITQEEVEATFYSQYVNDTFDSCFGKGCNLFVKTLIDAQIKVTAAGYLERTTMFKPSGEGTVLVIDLIPMDYEGTFVKFMGIFNSIGREVQDVETGEEYTAKILLAAPFAQKVGAYFRIGKETTAESDVAAIPGYASRPSATTVLKSASYSQTSSCADEPGTEFKWMNAEYESAESQEVGFRFKLKSNAERETSLPYYYRGYAVKDGNYLRVPEDEELGMQEKSAIVDWCKAKANEGEISIRKTSKYSCNSIGCLTVSLEQDGLEGAKNFQARVVKSCSASLLSPNSCLLGTLKVKASFRPNDATKEFGIDIGQSGSNLKFISASINQKAQDAPPESSVVLPLANEKEYTIIAGSLPQEEGNEKITVTVEEGEGEQTISKTLDFKIYESCLDGTKQCGEGKCDVICLKDAYDELSEEEKEQEEIPPEPKSEIEGQEYCSDGIFREDCEITATPREELPPDVYFEIKDGKIVAKGATVTVDEDGNPVVTPGETISKISMQIDTFVPTDAITLNGALLPKDCTPLYKVESATTMGCYVIRNNHLIFSGNELSPDCKLKTSGDEATGDASAKLRVMCLDSSITPGIIPIEVAVKKIPFKSVQLQPRALSGSTAKAFHLINEKQVPEKYTLADLKLQIDYADSFSYAWSGDGELALKEDGLEIDSVNYDRKDSYFPNIDDQGGRTPACYDFICCAGKWCTEFAARQAFSKFKESAEKVAKATLFRRGNNFISDEILKKPFSFSTIIRLVENAKLPAEIRTEDSPEDYGCTLENPKMWVVQATSKDGKNFEYVARVARLYKYNYVSPEEECKGSGRTPEMPATGTHGYFSGDNYLALCDFMRGYKKCIESGSYSSLASHEQVGSKKQLIPIPVPSTFLTAYPAAEVCRSGINVAVRAEWLSCLEVCMPACYSEVCAAACVESLGTACIECKEGCDAACMLKCNVATRSGCYAGNSPYNLHVPAVLPIPRFTSEICTPDPPKPEQPWCVPLCTPQISYVHMLTSIYGVDTRIGNAVLTPIHVGISTVCSPDYLGAGAWVVETIGEQYVYSKHNDNAKTIGRIVAGSISALNIGDFKTCTMLSILAKAKPDVWQLELGALGCSMISQGLPSIKSIFKKGDPKLKVADVPHREWSPSDFNFDDVNKAASSAEALNSLPSGPIVPYGDDYLDEVPSEEEILAGTGNPIAPDRTVENTPLNEPDLSPAGTGDVYGPPTPDSPSTTTGSGSGSGTPRFDPNAILPGGGGEEPADDAGSGSASGTATVTETDCVWPVDHTDGMGTFRAELTSNGESYRILVAGPTDRPLSSNLYRDCKIAIPASQNFFGKSYSLPAGNYDVEIINMETLLYCPGLSELIITKDKSTKHIFNDLC